jgi:hypothetical protein
MGLICEYYNECKKKSTTIMGPLCTYCIFEMVLWNFKMKKDVSITHLE